MPLKDRRKDARFMSYSWERIPRKLIKDAHVKCRAQEPPTNLKWKLRELLEAWVYSEGSNV